MSGSTPCRCAAEVGGADLEHFLCTGKGGCDPALRVCIWYSFLHVLLWFHSSVLARGGGVGRIPT